MKPKKPRTLNATWADARCRLDAGKPVIEVEVTENLDAQKATRLSLWLDEASTWAEQVNQLKGGKQ